jgi:hypothetical protein
MGVGTGDKLNPLLCWPKAQGGAQIMLPRWIALFGVLLLSWPVHAWVYDSATDMVKACRFNLKTPPARQSIESQHVMEAALGYACSSYLFGFIGGYYHGTVMYMNKPMLICFPPNPTREQLATIYVQWADRNANKWHEPVWNTVFAAFVEAFPCKDPL